MYIKVVLCIHCGHGKSERHRKVMIFFVLFVFCELLKIAVQLSFNPIAVNGGK
jgi:hypothetical protein